MRNLLNLFKKRLLTYDSIDELPLWNWVLIHNKKDTKYMVKAREYDRIKESLSTQVAFERCYQQYFDKYLITDDLIRFVEKKKEIALLEAEAYMNNRMAQLTLAEIKKEVFIQTYGADKLSDEPNGEKKEFDIETIISAVEKGLGFMIDRKKMSVDSFYKHLTNFVKDGKKNKE